MRASIVATLVYFTLSVPVCAQSDLSTLTPNDLVTECKDALASGKETKAIVDEMLRRDEIPLGPTITYDALNCLKASTGKAYYYEDRQFKDAAPKIAREKLEKEARDGLAAKEALEKSLAAERTQAYLTAVVNTCEEEYHQDRFRALTTPICGEVFKARGLPTR
jgi:hypothetical protein